MFLFIIRTIIMACSFHAMTSSDCGSHPRFPKDGSAVVSLKSWNDDISSHLEQLRVTPSITSEASLTLTPSPPFSFLDYLLGKGGVKKWGFPMGFEPGTPRTTMHCSPMARHSGVAARAAISFPYETRFYDVIGLSAFSSLPLVGFCWTVDG